MNCKPGDLAVVVKSEVGNEGSIVRCLRLVTSAEKVAMDLMTSQLLWHIEGVLRVRRVSTEEMRIVPVAADEWLRPIRDQDGEDETLSWAGKPEQITA